MVSIREQRKKERREGKYFILPALLFFLLFPYLMSGFSGIDKQTLFFEETPGQVWVVEKKLWGTQRISLEEYLIGMVAKTIPGEYETETLKAQAIILRSYCMKQMQKKNGKKVIEDKEIKEYYLSGKEREKLWGNNTRTYEKKIAEAVETTKGMVLVCRGDIVNPPFCRMSNGATRNIQEYVIHKDAYPYMKTVSCEHDPKAVDFLQYIEVSEKNFKKRIYGLLEKKIESLEKLVLYRDENGYVKEIAVGEERIDGEKFRRAFGLASSCFSLDKINDVIEIQTKGIGHGYGFSQYEADQLAQKGVSYDVLLEAFFENITLEKL